MIEFGEAIAIDGERIVPAQIGEVGLNVPLRDLEALVAGMVGTKITDPILKSATREQSFSIGLHAAGLIRVCVTRDELDQLVARCRDIVAASHMT